MRRGNAEDRHHGVADVLLDGPALRLDLGSHHREPRAHHLAQLLRVEPVGELGRPRHVGEENGDDLALAGDGRQSRREPHAEQKRAPLGFS